MAEVSHSPVKTSEIVGTVQRHDQDACAENENVRRLAQIKTADTTDEQISDGEIEQAPRDIDHRGRQAHAGRRCERALERMPGDPIAEMGQSVREEYAPEEVRKIVVPAHGLLLTH